MVVFLDGLDNLITCVPPGEIYLQKFGLSGFSFVISIESSVTSLIHKGKTAEYPTSDPFNQAGSSAFTTTGRSDSEPTLRYDFAVAHFLNILDAAGNPHGATFVDTLNALCAFLGPVAGGGSGEVNDAVNIGTGAGVYKQKTGVDLELRRVNSNDFTVTENANDITVNASTSMITNQTNVTAASGMQVLLEDSGTLKRANVSTFLGGGPPEIFTDNSFISTHDLTGQTNNFNTDINSYNGFASCSPFYLSADVIISRIGIEQRNASSVGVSARIGIFEYISNAGAYVPNYRFDKVYQMPTAVNAGVTGVQIFTLSPTVTLTGGKVYAAVVVHDSPTLAAGSPDKPSYFGARQLSLNKIIGRNPSSVTTLGRTLETTTNATVSGGVITNTINFTNIGQGNFSANPYIYLDIENA